MTATKRGADDAVADGQTDLSGLPRAETTAAPHCTRLGDDLQLDWPDAGVRIEVTGIREHREGATAEFAVSVNGIELHWARLGLASTQARTTFAKRLHDQHKALPWGTLVEQACRRTMHSLRDGAPFICLMPRLRPEGERFLIPNLLVRRESNVFFADGGHGKSLLGLALGIVATGVALPGIAPVTEPVRSVVYLDWESNKEEHEDRLFKLLAGVGIKTAPPIIYREMTRPLLEEVSLVRAVIAEHQAGVVIVDSLAPASGAEPESADAAVRTLTALRSFSQTTRVVLAHVSKASADQRTGPTRPFGSVFVQNLGRSVWEVRSCQDEDSDEFRMALFHRKANSGRLVSHPGLRFRFDAESIRLSLLDITEEPELVIRASLVQRLRAALAKGAKTIPDLARELGVKEDTIRKALVRNPKTFVQLDGDAAPYPWGLVVQR